MARRAVVCEAWLEGSIRGAARGYARRGARARCIYVAVHSSAAARLREQERERGFQSFCHQQ
ncbi:hypothetical protein A2U01_0093211 [Trifolium medium]|uniref:Uncharacterized protein n=1 Tax=Trifolium medium TaxID=97028 RepID=A0A392UG37_9FABA|nr:hypothetical protein [Trifolium medium]